MTENEILTKITTIIEDHFDVSTDKVTEQTNFKTDLDADSIDLVEFVLELEDTFGAEISDEDAEQIVTVKDAVDYIASHQG
ncbi:MULTISPECIES: acyl carrier protein [Ligilactobacillus]|uniref:Acyl carrier protein n=1 Tax=Ligilactobacillus animalis TaxID=1605 RepID=A0ABR4RQL4_9LACO|nr:acyl carrier protein [Ligilactobacillus animalis]KDA46080.1 acyl carrier protein, acpP [Ligilactobacillus animalis]MDO5883956.1 acyl carrier protein [Ligilactobacillus animalis]MDQ2233803.1 acyl carrier protein [Ligilactobacillus animalis]MDU1488013.1 acyl carrier protein [Ligilactobacillus animalis]MDU8987420.1 acyl carrier protein [Ligilactobacillus animalis]